jgi:prolyl-tRNA synthetase
MPLNTSESAQVEAAERIYSELCKHGVEAVMDDRDERPGVKFKDADLIGFPIRVIVGPKHLGDGEVEVSMRRDGTVELVKIENVAVRVKEIVDRELAALMPE